MSFPAPTTAVYRKTKQGDFVIFGPSELIEIGPVIVHLKSGATKGAHILSVGAEFEVQGVQCRYGYQTGTDSNAVTLTAAVAGSKPTAPSHSKADLDVDNFQPDDQYSGAEYVPPTHEDANEYAY